MTKKIPPNGILSGMIITIASAAFWIAAPLFSEGLSARFHAPLSKELLFWFSASCLMMAIHKLESYWAGEFDECPVYLYQGTRPIASDPRRLNFVVFVGTLLGMLLLCVLLMYGAPWPNALIGIWIGQSLHEMHHSAKSMSRRRLYPGTPTALIFSSLGFFMVFPLWWNALFPEYPNASAALLCLAALAWIGFYQEDRVWIRKLGSIPQARRTQRSSNTGTGLPTA